MSMSLLMRELINISQAVFCSTQTTHPGDSAIGITMVTTHLIIKCEFFTNGDVTSGEESQPRESFIKSVDPYRVDNQGRVTLQRKKNALKVIIFSNVQYLSL